MVKRSNHCGEGKASAEIIARKQKSRTKQAHHAKCDAVIEKCVSKNRPRGQGCYAASVHLQGCFVKRARKMALSIFLEDYLFYKKRTSSSASS